MSKQETVKMIEDVAKHEIDYFIEGYNKLPNIINGMKQVEDSIILKMKSHNIDELSRVKIEKQRVNKNITVLELNNISTSETLLSKVLVKIDFEETEKHLRDSGYNDTTVIPFIEMLKNKVLGVEERLVVKK